MDMFAATFCLLCVISGAGKGQNKLSVSECNKHKTKFICSPDNSIQFSLFILL